MDALAGMVECYRMDIEQILPEYPDSVTEDQISYVDGKDDYMDFMDGNLNAPKQPDNAAYMDGWRWAENNWVDEVFVVVGRGSAREPIQKAA